MGPERAGHELPLEQERAVHRALLIWQSTEELLRIKTVLQGQPDGKGPYLALRADGLSAT